MHCFESDNCMIRARGNRCLDVSMICPQSFRIKPVVCDRIEDVQVHGSILLLIVIGSSSHCHVSLTPPLREQRMPSTPLSNGASSHSSSRCFITFSSFNHNTARTRWQKAGGNTPESTLIYHGTLRVEVGAGNVLLQACRRIRPKHLQR
jgi:hypothetical protein